MTNPYQSPSGFDPKQFQDRPDPTAISAHDYSWVNQVRIFAILSAVQGALEIPMGLMTMGVGFLFPMLMRMEQANNPDWKQGNPPPEQFFWIMTVTYFVLGLPVFVGGLLRIFAAYRNYRFRGRTFGIVAMVVGMGSVLTCYCAPTAIAILVYGLILYLNPAVQAAFAMGEQGQPADKILASFVPYQQGYQFPAPGEGR